MREIFKVIKECFILILGTGLFTYGLFSFNSDYYVGVNYKLVIGAIFIVIGLLKIRRKKDGN